MLSLTLLLDHEERPLRLAVAQALGDAHARLQDPIEAIRYHAEAASLARTLGDPLAELDAVEMLGRDLAQLGRLSDAVGHAARALELALELKDGERAARIAEGGRGLLKQLDEPATSARWQTFEIGGG